MTCSYAGDIWLWMDENYRIFMWIYVKFGPIYIKSAQDHIVEMQGPIKKEHRNIGMT